MTKLERAVTRQTAILNPRRRRPYVIRLKEGGKIVEMWVKGERTRYTVPYEQIFLLGARIRAQELKEAKAKAKGSA